MQHHDTVVKGHSVQLAADSLVLLLHMLPGRSGHFEADAVLPNVCALPEAPIGREERACAGAVLASSSWLARLCFCCMVRQKICCMPLETTEMAAMTVPSTLFSISRSVMVLHRRQESILPHTRNCQPSASRVVRKDEHGRGGIAGCTLSESRSVMVSAHSSKRRLIAS